MDVYGELTNPPYLHKDSVPVLSSWTGGQERQPAEETWPSLPLLPLLPLGQPPGWPGVAGREEEDEMAAAAAVVGRSES